MAVDQLAARRSLCGVEAQIGHSSYEPKHCKFQRFHTREEMGRLIRAAEFVICHGGAGTLDECLELGKKLIVVPRLSVHGEAPDDHQLQIATHLAAKERVLLVTNILHLADQVAAIPHWKPEMTVKHEPSSIVETINAFIDGQAAATKDNQAPR